jgi:hypothetical protein
MPTVAVLAGGGAVAAREARAHLRTRRPVIVLAGSGRFADRLAGLARGVQPATGDVADFVSSVQMLEVWELSDGPDALAAVLRRCLREE